MSTNRSRRIDRDTAEQLLGGAAVGTSAGQAPLTGHEALAGVLAAAAAPAAGAGELPGERAALAAFREARRNPAPRPRRRTMASTAMARAFSAKAVAAAFAATAIGGVAVAASTGSLPGVLGGGSGADGPAVVSTGSGSPQNGPALKGRGGATNGTSPGASNAAGLRPSAGPGTSGGPAGTSSPGTTGQPTEDASAQEIVRLCHVYADKLAAGGKARVVLADPSLAPLVKEAGGISRVDDYCSGVAKSGQGGDTATPSAGHGSDGSTKRPSDSPTRSGGG